MHITINTSAERAKISPYIYGSNQSLSDTDLWTVCRLGGNRLSGYNWENNASNAVSDWQHSSDNFLTWISNIPDSSEGIPAIVATHFHDQSLAMNTHSIMTLQMAGYVSKDKNGSVDVSETAPSVRWLENLTKKDTTFTLIPDMNDNVVYSDEFVHFFVNRFGAASMSTDIRWYSLDNEPFTDPRIHSQKVKAEELVAHSIELASSVKNVDPHSKILGLVLYGFSAYETLQDASDWNLVRNNYRWSIDYYLDKLKEAEQTTGKRLLDVLDLHWYPEARGDKRIVFEGEALSRNDIQARVQAPRTLWDSSYVENSWIGMWKKDFLPIIPNIKKSIQQYYSGTKLAFTEYDLGGSDHISGGLAHADVLGIWGKYDVHLATYWQEGSQTDYISAAFNLFRNYDGNGSTYGDTKVQAESDNIETVSVYASIFGNDPSELHVIVLNKNFENAATLTFTIQSEVNYAFADVWSLNESSPNIIPDQRINDIQNNSLIYQISKSTASHLIFFSTTTSIQNSRTIVTNADLQAYPNPFNASVQIVYSIIPGKDGEIAIYNIRGQKIKVFENLKNEGKVRWTGRDRNNRRVASGVYFAKLKVDDDVITQDILFLK